MTTDHYNLFEEIGDSLASEGVRKSQMMGHSCLKASNGKIIAIYYHDDVVVKLPPDQLKQLLSRKDIKIFEPMVGRRMKNWARVPARYADEWETLIGHAKKHIAY